MPKAKIFMLDLHICGNGKENDFTEKKEKKFCALTKALKTKYSKGSEIIH